MSNIDRFFNLMKRTGLPVVVSQEGEEPIVIMPLDAYEMLIGPAADHNPSPSSASAEQMMSSPTPPEPDQLAGNSNNTDLQGFSSPSETPTSTSRQGVLDGRSAEDRFFLDTSE